MVQFNPSKESIFLFFRDKNVSRVSGAWKALHITIYIAIAIGAFVTAMAVGNLLQTFKYKCILFCSTIEFESEILSVKEIEKSKNSEINELLVDNDLAENITALEDNEQNQNITEKAFWNKTNYYKNKTEIFDNSLEISKEKTEHLTSVLNESILFKNETHLFQKENHFVKITQAKIDLRKSRFPSNFICNFVLGVPLVTFIFATFCAIIMTICSKGGQGQTNDTLNRPQNMVYPILITSVLLGIFNMIASIFFKTGIKEFCTNFEIFTSNKSCSVHMNKFTIHDRQDNFYLPYLVLVHIFDITVILIVCQVLLTILRIIYAVDYQLYALEINDNENEREFQVEDGQIKEVTL